MSQKQQERLVQQVDAEKGQIEKVQAEPEMPASESMGESPIPTPVAEDVDRIAAEEIPAPGDAQPGGEASQKKRKKRKTKWVSVDEVLPKPSYWPLALTISISVLLMGVMIHPIVIGVGAIFVIISIIGWMLERR